MADELVLSVIWPNQTGPLAPATSSSEFSGGGESSGDVLSFSTVMAEFPATTALNILAVLSHDNDGDFLLHRRRLLWTMVVADRSCSGGEASFNISLSLFEYLSLSVSSSLSLVLPSRQWRGGFPSCRRRRHSSPSLLSLSR
ncbi:hypothetical protein PIB30_075331 [Stylosanthes scabra]|uniref:Uncharacterized protein n=1 Tax=Stylosanthes scabra TaxID=79078 RepID=A0ABU6RPT4_9FABA|nr:hypothetical protein [Stylosanthes scabra]